MHDFEIVYYEPAAMGYELGKILRQKFAGLPWEPIENHNSIPFMQQKPNGEFTRMKRSLIVGVRKTHTYAPNNKTSDYLVPYTSSGCSAACLYCYLVCNYNKCAYLRLFVNREHMLSKIIRTAEKSDNELVFEIGSNSDLVLENTVTGNLEWTIGHFAHAKKGKLTFPTKFGNVDGLLPLPHGGRIIPRVSVNPDEIIRRVEIGTSPLAERMDAMNKLAGAGYPVGLLVAPVVLLPGWQKMYAGLFYALAEGLNPKTKSRLPIEIIFMTYSYVHRAINADAFPGAPVLYDPRLMTVRGRGRYCYRPAVREEAEFFIKEQISMQLPKAEIRYIV